MKRSVSEGIVISPIKNGTVIDHITPGEGLTVIRILGIQDGTNVTFTVATNVTSSRGGRKDMVKIENREPAQSEVDKIALNAPEAKISIIRDFKVVAKKPGEVPSAFVGVIKCPNPNRISHAREPAQSKFVVHPRGFRCQYCDTIISREMDIGDYI